MVDGNDQLAIWEDRDDFENEENTENEEDIRVNSSDFEDLLIAPSDWTVGTIYQLIGKQLHLDPAYQRRNVWQAKAKSHFIESLFLGIPIPQILLASRAGQKNSFLVLDGKQRLSTIREFIDGKYADGKKFRLKGLRILPQLEGKSWKDIENDPEWGDRLTNEPLRTTVLRGWRSESTLYEIFYRLNSGSVKLSPMELRMSLHPGEFLKFIIAWTENIGPLHQLLRKNQPDPRMSDVELGVRYLAFSRQKTQYGGDLKQFLDEYCKAENDEFLTNTSSVTAAETQLEEMNAAILSGINEFSEKHFCRKYSNNAYETRFNRAVFDVLVGSLSDKQVRDFSTNNPGVIKTTYEQTSMTSPDFVKSVESTTKSPAATRERFKTWYEAVNTLTGSSLMVPDIK